MNDTAYKTKQDFAYAHLHRAILNGDFQPGDRLRLDELAEQLGTSRTPLREAVRRLQTEGLVDIAAHRGVVVSGFSIAELAELYHIRSVLDGLAVRLATPRLTQDDLAALDAILARMEDGAGAMPAEEVNALNWRFHDILYRNAASPILYEMITNLYVKTQRYRVYSFRNQERNAQIRLEHRQLYRALATGEPTEAERCAIAHLENTAQALIALVMREDDERPGRPPMARDTRPRGRRATPDVRAADADARGVF